ncbi:bifunctional RNase H/acid phosphatase [compost metagenome]
MVKLTQNGVKQAQNAAVWLKDYCVDNNIDFSKVRIWRSPHLRARKTSEKFIEHFKIDDVKEDITLGEQQFGLFDATPEELWEKNFPVEYAECQRQWNNDGKFYVRYPGGESPYDVAIRIYQFIEKIQRDSSKDNTDTIFVFTHGTVIKCFLLRWFDHTPEWYEQEKTSKNCGIRFINEDKDEGYIYSV